MRRSILDRLNQPYPGPENPRSVFLNMLWAGLVVFFILYLFRPFGLGRLRNELLGICAIFGGITYVIGILYELLFLRMLPIDRDSPRWTFKDWLLSTLGMVTCIAIANYVFLYLISGDPSFYWSDFLRMILYTFLVALFPVTIAGLLHQNRQLKRNLREARRIDPALSPPPARQHKILHIKSKEQNESFSGSSAALYYVEAMQNYVVIHFETEGRVEKQVLRNSLSDTCRQICDRRIVRCHRSFIVNLDRVLHVEGNAQGLTLLLDQHLEVPVSRSYIEEVRAAIER